MVTKQIITQQSFDGLHAMVGDVVLVCVDYQGDGSAYLRCGVITFITDADQPLINISPYEKYMPLAHMADGFMGEHVPAYTVAAVMAMQPGQWTFQSRVQR